MDNRAIGVFDSGLGGLTVVRQLMTALPNENIVYFGDTGRVPYGSRSDDAIRRYAAQDISFLLSKDVKLVVAACGTVSSVAADIKERLSVPFIGVVEPAAAAAAKASKSGKIGVIGTAATVGSGSFSAAIKRNRADSQVIQTACPMFVPLVESGWYDSSDPVVLGTVERYLQPMLKASVDTLVLGCTHYPILADAIAAVMGEGVTLIDTGVSVAEQVKQLLNDKDMMSTAGGANHFYVSDTVRSFEQMASLLLGDKAEFYVEKIDIERY